MADAQLVHGVQAAPRLALHIEQMHLAVPICVLAADKNDLRWRDGQGGARPEWVLRIKRARHS